MRQFDIKMPLIVINGDVLTRLNAGQLLEYHNSNGARATMCVRKHSITIPYGVVESNGSFLKNIRENRISHTWQMLGFMLWDIQP